METTTTEVQESVTDQTETVETEASDQQAEEVSSETTETGSDTQGTEDQGTAQAESDDEPPLPKWLQKYDKALVDEFQDRFQLTQEQLDDPQRKSLFKAVLDKEQYIKELQGKDQNESTEDVNEETAATQTKSPDEQYAEFDKNLSEFVAKGRNGQPLNDPRLADAFAKEWLSSQGIDANDPAKMAELKKQGFDPVRMSNAYAKFGTNLITTVLQHPQIFAHAVENAFPGFGELFNTATEGNYWEGLRGKEAYSQLPQHGTQEYHDAMKEIEKANPWFKDAQFKNRDARQEALASLAMGRRVDPKLMEQAVATGKAQGAKAASKLAVAKSLSSGKSKGELTPKPKGNEDLRSAIQTYMDGQKSGNR